MAKRESKLNSKIPIDMTPMIDVVFQLLTFFMLSMKTVLVEGDFSIRMPLGAGVRSTDEDVPPPINVRMIAAADGSLADVKVGGKGVAGGDLLNAVATADAMLEAASKVQGNRDQMIAARKAKEQSSAQLTAVIQQAILNIVNPTQAPAAELELDCDPELKYDYVVSAMNAASGQVQDGQVVPLIQKIKFSPPRKAR